MIPNEIETKQFGVTRLREGYDQAEVDGFLDDVQAAWSADRRALAEAQQRLSAARLNAASSEAQTQVLSPVPVQQPPAGPSLESIALLLSQAEQAAADIRAKAEQDAGYAALAAQQKGEKDVAAARAQAAQIVADAQAQANAALGELEQQRAAIQAKVDGLKAVHADVYDKLGQALDALAEEEEEGSADGS